VKKLLPLFGLASMAMAAEWTGYIVDKSCAGNKAMWTNSACVEKCANKGQPLVLATEEGKVYAIADQDKVKSHGGHKVTITGTMDGDTIKVESVKM
jgi:hypothetical protein